MFETLQLEAELNNLREDREYDKLDQLIKITELQATMIEHQAEMITKQQELIDCIHGESKQSSKYSICSLTIAILSFLVATIISVISMF